MVFSNHIIEAGFFGAVQGLTEFLPISSSGHLFLLHSIINIHTVNEQTFDVALHVGTFIALLWYFWGDVWLYIRAVMAWVRTRPAVATVDQRMAAYLVISAVPGAILGALFESWFETAVRSPLVVAATLMSAGVALWAADRWVGQRRSMADLSFWQAVVIGLGQALALIPGVSRSGATITVGRLLGLTREAAARFSFLMAIPIVAGAALKKSGELVSAQMTTAQTVDMVVGVVVAAGVGYLAIRGLLRFVSRQSYAIFAIYRLALGLVILLTVWLK